MPDMINVSTYELLVRPIIGDEDSRNRTVIQGYFLTIANPSSSELEIELTFRASTPDFPSSNFVAFWDVSGSNLEVDPDEIPPITTGTYRFSLPAWDTGLFLLLPNVQNPRIIADRTTEIRGYVRLAIPSATPIGMMDTGNRTLLLSAQQRGTFLPQGAINAPEVGDYDQVSYSLPLASGASEVTVVAEEVDPVFIISDLVRETFLDAIENDPGLISKISSDEFAQMLSGLNPDEQRQMLKLFLERADAQLAVAR